MHKAWSRLDEVPYCFPMSSVKFWSHMGQKKSPILTRIWIFQTVIGLPRSGKNQGNSSLSESQGILLQVRDFCNFLSKSGKSQGFRLWSLSGHNPPPNEVAGGILVWLRSCMGNWVTIRYNFSHKHLCHNWLFNSLTSCVGSCYQTETAYQWVCGTGSWWVALTLRHSQLVHSTLLNHCPGALLVSILTSNKTWRTRNAMRSSNGDCEKTMQHFAMMSASDLFVWYMRSSMAS